MDTSSENNCEEKESSEKIQFIQNLKNLKLKDVFKKGVNNATFVVMQSLRRLKKTSLQAKKIKPENDKELSSAPCVLVPTLAFPETTTEKAAAKAHEEKALKDVVAKLKKSKEFDDIDKKLEDTKLKGNQKKVTQFLKNAKAEEAFAAAKKRCC